MDIASLLNGKSSVSDDKMLQNLETGKQKKDEADLAFKQGDTRAALRSYHESLLFLKGVSSQKPHGESTKENEEKQPLTEDKLIMEKVYNNMAACHIKHGNWARAVETADKALAINEHNHKALFRKGKALGEQGYFEKAEKIFDELLKKDLPDAAAIKTELAQLKAKDKEREKKHNAKIRGFLSREKGLLADESAPSEVTEASITEVA